MFTIKGFLYGKKGSIITTNFEHVSINLPLKTLEREGFEVVHIETDEKGWLDKDKIKSHIREDTLMLTMGAVCRETSTLRDIKGIVSVVKSLNPSVVCHFDMWGLYYPDTVIDVIDMASFSGISFNAPLGIGFLYIKKGIKIKPLIEGGFEEKGLRAGEENIFGIALLSKSINFLVENRDKIEHNLKACEDFILNNLQLTPAFKRDWKAPYIFSYGLESTNLEGLVYLMEKHGFYINDYKACAINKTKSRFENIITFRLHPSASVQEVESFIEALNISLKKLRSLS